MENACHNEKLASNTNNNVYCILLYFCVEFVHFKSSVHFMRILIAESFSFPFTCTKSVQCFKPEPLPSCSLFGHRCLPPFSSSARKSGKLWKRCSPRHTLCISGVKGLNLTKDVFAVFHPYPSHLSFYFPLCTFIKGR